MTAWSVVGQNEQFSPPYRAVGFKVLWYGNVMIGGEFGHHAFVFSVPQDTVQVWKVLEDVKAILGEMSCCPSTQLRSLWGEKINKLHRDLSHPRPPTQHNPPTFFHFPPTFQILSGMFNQKPYLCGSSPLTASKASWCPSGLSEGTRWMRIPSTSCWALGFLSLYSLHKYCMRSKIISRPVASFP